MGDFLERSTGGMMDGRKKKKGFHLTPGGIEEKTRMTYHFLKRKTAEYEQLELEIRQLQAEVQLSGSPAEEMRELRD